MQYRLNSVFKGLSIISFALHVTVSLIFLPQNAGEFTLKSSTQTFTHDSITVSASKLNGALFVTVCDQPVATYHANCLRSTFRVAEQIYLVSRAAVEREAVLLW
jgi:hypothetical protein